MPTPRRSVSRAARPSRPAHLLTLSDLGAKGIAEVLREAAALKKALREGRPHRRLEGRTLGMVFEKASTRTRVSFEVGMFQLGGHALHLSAQGTQIGRGEPPQDTARVLSRYVDLIMVRTFAHGPLETFARYSRVPVINGLTDLHHPCQLLADLMTIREKQGRLAGRIVAWIGDGNNMANSWIEAAGLLGMELRVATPKGYAPNPAVLRAAREIGRGRIMPSASPIEAARGADVVATDVWASMGAESQAARRRRAFRGFTVDAALMRRAAPGAIVLHCLPAHRGEEIAAEVFETHAGTIFEEAENRLHVQKALMCRLAGA